VAGIADNPSVPVQQGIPAAAAGILAAVSVSHLLNDIVQSLIPAVYPIFKVSYHLNFAQIGLITLVGN
jgi:MFS transporter, FSR family, fosmidomycin resistance protein